MANPVCEVLVTESRLEIVAGIGDAAPGSTIPATEDVDLSAGAIVDFWGVVRKLENSREIEGIDYEAHTAMAEHQLGRIATAAAEKFHLEKVIVHHRIGFIRAGEASLFLRVASSHRTAAFGASKWIVDELKKKVPIWKQPKFSVDSVAGIADAGPGSPIPATDEPLISRR
jgi:molybdopterin synthase catalytic subunit